MFLVKLRVPQRLVATPYHGATRYSISISALIISTVLMLGIVQANAGTRQPSTPTLAVLYDDLIPELQRGGTAIYFVPFDTIGEDQTGTPDWWKQCTLSRMISKAGIDQALAVRRAIARLQLNIQFAESGEHCASLSTYSYLLGNQSVRFFVTPDLNPVEVQRLAGMRDQTIEVHVLGHLQTVIADSVKILSGVKLPLSASPHPVLADLAPAESAIFRSTPNGELTLLARLNWHQWEEMADYYVVKSTASSTADSTAKSKPVRRAR